MKGSSNMHRKACDQCGRDTMHTYCTVCETNNGYGISVSHDCAQETVTECSFC